MHLAAGYGDISPYSASAKLATCIAILFGVLCMAMPLAIVGSNFQDAWSERWTVVVIECIQAHLLASDGHAWRPPEHLLGTSLVPRWHRCTCSRRSSALSI